MAKPNVQKQASLNQRGAAGPSLISPPSTHAGGLIKGTGRRELPEPVEQRIMAIDPSTSSLGWAIGSGGKIERLGTIRPKADFLEDRFTAIIGQLSAEWRRFARNSIHGVVMEKAAGFQRGGRYIIPEQLQALMVRLRQWAAMELQSGVYEEYHPSTVRAQVTNPEIRHQHGKDVKAQLRAGVLIRHPALENMKVSQDAIDAVAVLDCHWVKTGVLPKELQAQYQQGVLWNMELTVIDRPGE